MNLEDIKKQADYCLNCKTKPCMSGCPLQNNIPDFIKAIKEARKYDPSLDSLVIFAGACQSNYEELIKAGANFASSPSRVMIHALDPLLVVEKIACSRIDKIVPLEEVLGHTVTGMKGVGGIETRGKFRLTMPSAIYNTY